MSVNRNYKDSTVAVRVMCAILFLGFSFIYLYYYQDDVMAMTQHVLSGGKTHYNRTIGAILMTLVLWLLQIGVYKLSDVRRRLHSLTYFPSLLVLTFVSSSGVNLDRGFSFGGWLFWGPLLLVVCGLLLWYINKVQVFEPDEPSRGILSQSGWISYTMLAGMFMMVGLFSNHNDVFHYRMRAEMCLMDSDYKSAADVALKERVTDSSLTMIRIYALARQGELGERLFEYPIEGGSDAMLPDSVTTKFMVYPEGKVYKFLGGWFKQRMSTYHYLNFIRKHHLATKAAHDYLLTAYLLDRNLDGFVRALPKYYDVNGQLPKHYREALILYTHKHSSPVISYHNSVMDADYEDYQQLIRKYNEPHELYSALKDTYGDTYWFYYHNK